MTITESELQYSHISWKSIYITNISLIFTHSLLHIAINCNRKQQRLNSTLIMWTITIIHTYNILLAWWFEYEGAHTLLQRIVSLSISLLFSLLLPIHYCGCLLKCMVIIIITLGLVVLIYVDMWCVNICMCLSLPCVVLMGKHNRVIKGSSRTEPRIHLHHHITQNAKTHATYECEWICIWCDCGQQPIEDILYVRCVRCEWEPYRCCLFTTNVHALVDVCARCLRCVSYILLWLCEATIIQNTRGVGKLNK